MQRQIMWLGSKIHDALVEFAKENDDCGFSSDLCGACAVGSYLLVEEAKRRLGIRMNFRATHSHAWAEHRGFIYDITATQFDFPYRIRVRRRGQIKEEVHHFKNGLYHYLNEDQAKGKMAIEDVNFDWPWEQRPKHWQLKWVNQHKAKVIFLPDQYGSIQRL